MVAARAAVSPTMSPAQQKLMQYLPVVFAIFQVFFLAGLIIYYMAQAVLRIGQQAYITKRFYGHEESLGRQAQRAGDEARELAKKDGGGGGLFARAKRDADPEGGDAGARARPRSARRLRRVARHRRARRRPAPHSRRRSSRRQPDQEQWEAPALSAGDAEDGVHDGVGRDDGTNGRGGPGAGPRPARGDRRRSRVRGPHGAQAGPVRASAR